MAGPEFVLDLAVVLRALVDILDHQARWRAGCHLLPAVGVEDAGQDLHLIRFAALGGVPRLAGPALVEKRPADHPLVSGDARRAAVDDAPMAGPWLSPQVVRRKRWPNVLWLMGPLRSSRGRRFWQSRRCNSWTSVLGQTGTQCKSRRCAKAIGVSVAYRAHTNQAECGLPDSSRSAGLCRARITVTMRG